MKKLSLKTNKKQHNGFMRKQLKLPLPVRGFFVLRKMLSNGFYFEASHIYLFCDKIFKFSISKYVCFGKTAISCNCLSLEIHSVLSPSVVNFFLEALHPLWLRLMSTNFSNEQKKPYVNIFFLKCKIMEHCW